MSALALRHRTRRLRPHAAGELIVLALGAIIAAHHSEMAAGDMHHTGMGTALELCLGVVTAVGAGVAALALALRSLGWRTLRRLLAPDVRLVPPRLTPEPRAGPPAQPLLCVWRR